MLSYKEYLMEGKDKFPNIKTLKVDGYDVLIGRDAASNDHLTTIMAKDDDLWFHTRGCPGSHVLIKIKDKLATPELIKQVAMLAVQNSKAKNNKKAIVVYCKAKFVKKHSGTKDGEVSVDDKNCNEIEIHI